MKKHMRKKTKIAENDSVNTQECHIAKLNDDCLINIMKKLSIKDRISSERGMLF